MTGLEKILKAIEKDARAESAAVLSAAKKEAEKIKEEAKEQAGLQCEEISRQSANDTAAVLSRAESAAELLKRKTLLLKKQELIGKTIENAHNSIFKLESKRYFDMLLGMAKKYAEKQAGEIAFNEKDLKRLPADFEVQLNSALSGSGASLSVCKKPRDIDGGFVLIYGGVEENCSFKALFEAQREELQDQVYSLLFS